MSTTTMTDPKLDSKVPSGPLQEKWSNYLNHAKLVNPNNKRKHTVLVVGTGLAGASAAASLAELGYNVKSFCIQDSARRAHSIAAQGGINAAKNYPDDGDSVWRLFYDTIKGGDYRAREANVHRLAQISNSFPVAVFERLRVKAVNFFPSDRIWQAVKLEFDLAALAQRAFQRFGNRISNAVCATLHRHSVRVQRNIGKRDRFATTGAK